MARTMCRTIGSLVLILLFSTYSFCSTNPQEDLQVLKDRVSQAEEDSLDEILANLELTNALAIQKDNLAALDNAKHTYRIAKALGETAIVFVAHTHVKTLEAATTGIRLEEDASPELLNDASPQLRYLYYSRILQCRLWHISDQTDFKTLLYECKQAAIESESPTWLLQQQAWDLYTRSTFANETRQDYLKLRKLARTHSYDEGLAISYLVENVVTFKESSFEEKAKVLKNALSHAKDSNNRLLVAKCNEELGVAYLLRKNKDDWSIISSHLVATIKELEATGYKYLADSRRLKFGHMAKRMGKSLVGLAEIRKVEQSETFRHRSSSSRNSINRTLSILGAQTQNSELQNRFREKVLSQQEKKQKLAEEEFAKANREKLWELRADARKKKEEHLVTTDFLKAEHAATKTKMTSETEKAAKSARFYQVLAGCLALLTLLMIPWLYIYRQQLKLNQVSDELDQSEEKCDELSLRINRLQRMESLGLMAGSVAHDFNNILVGVMGNAEVLQMTNDAENNTKVDDEFVSQRICSIIRSAEKAANLSRQMLAYAGKQFIARKPTDLNELIRQYESILRSTCRKQQTLKFEFDAHPVISKVDVTQIEQVILNLVTNAAEASGVSDEIVIRTGTQVISSVEDDSSLYGTRTSGGEFTFIEIVDAGSGISTADLERIFEPFFSNSEIGRGLGLSVVYGVVIGHEGFIRCRSNVGKGTSFRVLIPLSTDVATADIAQPRFENVVEFDDKTERPIAKKILVIDDEEAVLDLCSQLMEFNGWDVISAVGGKAGLDQIEEHLNEIACILVDVVMPEMGANELLNELEERQVNIPVVLMSGFSQTRLEFFLERENVSSIVQKPFRANEIKRAILDAAQEETAAFVSSSRIEAPDNPK